jgi:type I restriction enzyme R subunit
MMMKDLPQQPDQESLGQLFKEELVGIIEMLDQLLQSYSPELYEGKCRDVYKHVYDSYYGQGRSIYARAS